MSTSGSVGKWKGRDVLAFMDAISVGTATETEHFAALAPVLDTLLQAGARLKLSKCKFGGRSVGILGHEVDNDELRPPDAHLDTISRLVEPASGDELMWF